MLLNELKIRQLVCIWDPAIDAEASDLVEYLKTRDTKHLVYLAGAKPEVYHLRPITSEMFTWVNAPEKPEEKFARAFYASVVKITGYYNEENDNQQQDEWSPSAVQNAGGALERVIDLFTGKGEKNKFAPGTLCEIGEPAYRQAFFPKRIAVSYQLSPMSLQIWQTLAVQRAEQALSLEKAGKSESMPQGETSAPVETQSASVSE